MPAKQRRRGSNLGKKIVIIPARMASNRLPGKPMLEAAGKPLVQWTYEQAKMTDADHVIVATGDAEIARHCQETRMIWMLTTSEHPNGTSRVAEVFAKLKPEVQEQVYTIVNWQVDEPMVEPTDANALMAMRVSSIGTLVCSGPKKFRSAEYTDEPDAVKVVWSCNHCHWFSRTPMRGAGFHVGLYSFTPFLLRTASMLIPSRLAKLESLEQLTWLENGLPLKPVEIENLPLSINTSEDWKTFKQLKEQEN